MSSKTIKKILLGVLVLVLIYIWWGNIRLFLSTPEAVEPTMTGTQTETPPPARKTTRISYLPPKTNPFWRPARLPKTSATPAAPAPVIPLIRQTHTLKGILRQKGQSQAILVSAQNASTIVAVGDSVGLWRVEAIGDSTVTFTQGKRRNTLRLGYHK